MTWAVLGCSGSAFHGGEGGEGGETDGFDNTDTSDRVVLPNRGGTSTTTSTKRPTPGEATTSGGVAGSPAGGAPDFIESAPGGAGGEAGRIASAGAGGVDQPPDDGVAGDPNLPDPPVDPNCAGPLREDWSAAIGSLDSDWHVEFGDPYVDVLNHRLVVTYDDVASRNDAYEGGYHIAGVVTLEGGTALTPYPYAGEKVWPSVRRSSSGLGVELGGTRYGVTEHWTNDDWLGFSGTTISGTKQVVVTMYVKASAKAVALKVSHGEAVYRSGWISDFEWPATDLGVFRYVGENNSAVYPGDAVYVGPLRGCQQLSDTAVELEFEK